jgi:hypothetical protein
MKKFRENLKAQTPFVACAERLDLPMKSGNQYILEHFVLVIKINLAKSVKPC